MVKVSLRLGVFTSVLMLVSVVARSEDATQPMSFTLHNSGGNCADCQWVQATGIIESDTAEKFRRFYSEFGCEARVNFLSAGGSLLGALSLGEALRDLGCNTSVGSSVPFEDTDFSSETPGTCLSACIYALMGGRHRAAFKEDTVGIHQDFLPAALDFADINQFAVGALPGAQGLTHMLVSYADSMGVDPLVVAWPAQIVGDQPIMQLNPELLAQMRLINNQWQPARWALEVFDDHLLARVIQPQKDRVVTAQATYHCTVNDDTQIGILSFELPAALWQEPDSRFCAAPPGQFQLVLSAPLSRYELALPPAACDWHRDDDLNWIVTLAVQVNEAEQAVLGLHETMSISWVPMVFRSIWSQEFSLDGFAAAARLVRRNCLR